MMIPIVLRMTDKSTRPAAKWLREVTTSVARTNSMYIARGTEIRQQAYAGERRGDEKERRLDNKQRAEPGLARVLLPFSEALIEAIPRLKSRVHSGFAELLLPRS